MPGPAAFMLGVTDHAGLILSGFPLVLMGGLPAARMADVQLCPMFDVLIPHVGGVILEGSFTVLIGGLPAASFLDIAFCIGPPAMIMDGFPGVEIL